MAHLPGASSTPRRQPDRGQGQEGSPKNATNRLHRVDFRRSWMPSPEMPRPPLPANAVLAGIEEAEDGREHEYERRCEQHHAHHPLDLRRARPRSSRMHGGDENQTVNVNPNVNPNPNPNPNPNLHPHPAPRRSVSGSTGTSSTRTAHTTHNNNTYAHAGRCQQCQCHCHCQCSSCKRPLRSTGTLSGSAAGHSAAAYAHTYNVRAQQAQPHLRVGGDDLPVQVPRMRQAPASARPSARPRPPGAREQERDSEEQVQPGVRRKSWLSVLSPKKLFSPRAYAVHDRLFAFTLMRTSREREPLPCPCHCHFALSLLSLSLVLKLWLALFCFAFHFAWEI